MRPLRYSINVTLDGCCDHRAMAADEELHRHAIQNLERADALLFGRVIYQLMETSFRPQEQTEAEQAPDSIDPFARAINAAKKYVVSSTLQQVDWNAQLLRGDLGKAVQQLKQEPGKGLFVGGVQLPLALAELGLIDEYEFVVHPGSLATGRPCSRGCLGMWTCSLWTGWNSARERWRCGMCRTDRQPFHPVAGLRQITSRWRTFACSLGREPTEAARPRLYF